MLGGLYILMLSMLGSLFTDGVLGVLFTDGGALLLIVGVLNIDFIFVDVRDTRW